MALNQSQADIIEDRRREVAILRRRRLSYRQIARALEKAGRVNEQTGEAWSYYTIKNDLDALKELAKAESLKQTSEHKAEALEDYQELLRVHWNKADHEGVRKVWKDIRDLLGTDAPQVIVFEQVQKQMDAALDALEREFAHEPALLERTLNALMGQSHNTEAARQTN